MDERHTSGAPRFLLRAGKTLLRMAAGAALGALAAVLIGQMVGLVAERCTFACRPPLAAAAGALGGALAALVIRPVDFRPPR